MPLCSTLHGTKTNDADPVTVTPVSPPTTHCFPSSASYVYPSNLSLATLAPRMNYLGVGQQDEQEPLPGSEYLRTLHKYLTTNINRLAPASPKRSTPTEPSFLQQSYTLLTLGLDPNSQPLSRNVVAPLTLGFGQPSQPQARQVSVKPISLRLPPDRLLFLLLRWQSLPQSLPHVGRTDEPIAPGVPVAARGAAMRERKAAGDVESVRSWVGSMRSVSMGSMRSSVPGFGWMRKEELDEGKSNGRVGGR